MTKKMISNLLQTPQEALRRLAKGENAGERQFVEKKILGAEQGFENHVVVFCFQEKYYKFLEVRYLNGQDGYQAVYSKPYEVFMEQTTKTFTTYTPWVEEE